MKMLLVAFALLIAYPLRAEWKPEYASSPAEVQQWYRDAELTDAARKRFPYKKCCDHADVVETQFRVTSAGAQDEWWWLDGDMWRQVQADIIHWGMSAPGGSRHCLSSKARKPASFPATAGYDATGGRRKAARHS